MSVEFSARRFAAPVRSRCPGAMVVALWRRTSRARRAAIAWACGLAAVAAGQPIRVATFNASLYGQRSGEVVRRLKATSDAQAQRIAEIIQRVRPDVLLLNEVDYDARGEVLAAFCDNYLAVGQNAARSPSGPAAAVDYPYRLALPTNTGEHSGFDLDRNGRVDSAPGAADYAGDCWGYGAYPGQYGFAVLSRYPIDSDSVRQFRTLLWKDVPGAMLPDDAATSEPADWYSAAMLAGFRLSSKNHCDVPIIVNGRRIHLLMSHPTPPVYDGAEDRNGRRNHDELRLWADYINADKGRNHLRDDAGREGSLAADEALIVLGDLNGDPHDGEGQDGIRRLLASERLLNYPAPTSAGAVEQARLQGGANARHAGDPAADTCDPPDDPGPGNLRLDYVLPSKDFRVTAAGVFWPTSDDPLSALVAGAAQPASSDHRLVWVDLDWANP